MPCHIDDDSAVGSLHYEAVLLTAPDTEAIMHITGHFNNG
jgi:hypothetical protein